MAKWLTGCRGTFDPAVPEAGHRLSDETVISSHQRSHSPLANTSRSRIEED